MSTRPETGPARHLARLAEKLRADPAYMAHTLHEYQERERLDDDALARGLHLQVDRLPRLKLCKRPSPRSKAFSEELRQIAVYTGADHVALAQIIRNVDSIEQMKNLPSMTGMEAKERALPSTSGLLAAARDSDAMDSDEESSDISPKGDEPRS